jgi:hypothetical protein
MITPSNDPSFEGGRTLPPNNRRIPPIMLDQRHGHALYPTSRLTGQPALTPAGLTRSDDGYQLLIAND